MTLSRKKSSGANDALQSKLCSGAAWPVIALMSGCVLCTPHASAATLSSYQRLTFDAATADLTAAQRKNLYEQISRMSDAEVSSIELANKSNPALLRNSIEALLTGKSEPKATDTTLPQKPLDEAEPSAPSTTNNATPTMIGVPDSLGGKSSGRQPDPYARTEPYRLIRDTRTINDVAPFLQSLATTRLKTSVAGYSVATPLDAELNYRGLRMSISSPSGSTALRLQVPGAGIDHLVSASSRDLSLLRLGSYLTGDDGQIARRLLRGVVSTATDDAIAGNPSSLLGRMLAMDFRSGTQSFGATGEIAYTTIGDFGDASLIGWHQFGHGSVNTLAAPLKLGHTLNNRWKIYAEAVPAFQEIHGSPVYSAMLATGVQLDLHEDEQWRWLASASARIGIAGSSQVEAVGGFLGGAISTELQRQIRPDFRLSGAVTVGHYKSLPMDFGPYNMHYDVSNTGLRFGVAAYQDVGTIAGLKAAVSASISDSRFTGSRLAVDAWQEYSVMLTVGKEVPVRVGAAYMNGNRGVQGISLRASISF